ncbi:MAG TPA: hypothetical protein VJ892_01410 [Candidatus Absconditabacterales bacterium]|nr:hypothetical protein [Candidatus Absconditabacterales bacterium]
MALDNTPKYQDMSKRLEQNHQGLIKDAFEKGETQVRIGGEIYNILQSGEEIKLEFSKKDPDSIFNLDLKN